MAQVLCSPFLSRVFSRKWLVTYLCMLFVFGCHFLEVRRNCHIPFTVVYDLKLLKINGRRCLLLCLNIVWAKKISMKFKMQWHFRVAKLAKDQICSSFKLLGIYLLTSSIFWGLLITCSYLQEKKNNINIVIRINF